MVASMIAYDTNEVYRFHHRGSLAWIWPSTVARRNDCLMPNFAKLQRFYWTRLNEACCKIRNNIEHTEVLQVKSMSEKRDLRKDPNALAINVVDGFYKARQNDSNALNHT